MADSERFDPPLLSECQRDEESEFNDLRHGEVLVKFRPERIICYFRIPDYGAGVGQRGLFALGELG
jgi:hypothetical protein